MNTTIRRAPLVILLPIFCLLFAAVAPARAQLAVQADTVYTMASAPIVNGIVLVDGGTIQEVGSADQVSIPDGYETISATVVTPGLVDAHATVGLSGIYNVDADQDHLDTSSPLQPHLRAIDAYNPREQLVTFVRQLGVTTVHAGHSPGALMSGKMAVFKTTGSTVEEAVVEPGTMVAMALGPPVHRNFESPGTRAKDIAMLRSELLKAQQYRANREEEDGSSDDLAMETLVRVLDGEVPALITAHKAHEIQAALRLAEEFGFDLVLDGAAEAYLVLDEIREAGVPVILHPTMTRPGGSAENAAFTTAAHLHEAGIPFAIQSGYEAYVPKTRIILYEAAIAVAHGLPREAALRSITLDAAQIIGVGDRVGSIEAGKDADLTLFDGDPMEYTTHVCTVIIEGDIVSDTCR